MLRERAAASAASISTCTRGRTSTTTRPNSASAPASPAARFPEAALICNLPGGQPGDPGLMTHDDVDDVLPRVRPPGARAPRGPAPVGRHRRHQHRAGLRRGAVADARGVDVGSGDARDLREALPDQRADSGGARRSRCAARTSSARRSASGSRWSTRSCRCRSTTAIRRPVDTTAMVRDLTTKYRPYPVRRGHALPDLVRPPRRLLGRVLHLHVVARHREGSLQPVRPREPAVAGASRAEYRDTILVPGGSKPAAAAGRGLPRPPVRLQGLGRLAEPRAALAEGSKIRVLRF